ncbi:MAG TPA: MBOAT family O-acyltransferase [Candidatus Limnocylindria bacterium]|jgi:alginate O-acetyltransferase complex protein AlgI|nr:MBOAT family O-acyltransferase [Candidatus Limnocylindria bacterium]
MTRLDFWIWLGLTSAVHWSLPANRRLVVLAGACLAYLGWVQPGVTAAFFLGTLLVYQALRAVAAKHSPTLCLTLVAGLSVLLAAWKFLPTAWVGLTFKQTAVEGLVPLGISYLIFKLIHVAVEVKRGTLLLPDFPEFLTYIFFVPMFSAGPIERLDHFRAQREATCSRALVAEAGIRILHGFIKKFGLSEGLLYHLVQNQGLDDDALNLSAVSLQTVWMVTAINYLRIYLDFSGYSDLAVGTGKLLGFHLMENFHWPILASNPSEFWRRWHISLSQWCQLYIYMPAMGMLRSPYIPLFMTFLVMGAWHIISWNRVGWAAYNAAGVIVFMCWSRWMGRARPGTWRASRAWKGVCIASTQAFVLGSVAFFMNGEDQPLARSLEFLKRMAGF